MNIIARRKLFYWATAAVMALSVALLVAYGFNPGIDFKGGTIIEVSYPAGRPGLEEVRSSLDTVGASAYTLRPTGDDGYSLESAALTPESQNLVLSALSFGNPDAVKVERLNTISPVIGENLVRKAFIALGLIVLAVTTFVAFAFRKVSKPVSSWKYGFATIAALAHDVLVPTGAYALWGYYTGAEVDLLFVTAVLAILGYSINDTIVVFDRVRENLAYNQERKVHEDFEKTVGKSLDQTIVRSINTSMTLFLVLVAIFVFGAPSTRDFIFVLLVGTVAGTFSSIFLAAPLLVTMEKLQKRGK